MLRACEKRISLCHSLHERIGRSIWLSFEKQMGARLGSSKRRSHLRIDLQQAQRDQSDVETELEDNRSL